MVAELEITPTLVDVTPVDATVVGGWPSLEVTTLDVKVVLVGSVETEKDVADGVWGTCDEVVGVFDPLGGLVAKTNTVGVCTHPYDVEVHTEPSE